MKKSDHIITISLVLFSLFLLSACSAPAKSESDITRDIINNNYAYVANPNLHYSSHNRGNTVDITLVTTNGDNIEMPSEFDSFTSLADRDYSDCSESARENAVKLENAMKANGFIPYYVEWWHYSDEDYYEVDQSFYPPISVT